jgi:peptidoglycan/xylan/chitin deacetylase (PgdA/CDA1 family)
MIWKILLLILTLTSQAQASECTTKEPYKVFLTFDDGPHIRYTPIVLDVLKKHHIHATFFILGDRINKSTKPIIARMTAEGHTIGSHTFHHWDHRKYSTPAARENITKPFKLWPEYFKSQLIRLPYGAGWFHSDRRHRIMTIVEELGAHHVGWHIDSQDWNKRRRKVLTQRMMQEICKVHGGVILFHDIQAVTVRNLERWIETIEDAGYIISNEEVPVDFAGDEKYNDKNNSK